MSAKIKLVGHVGHDPQLRRSSEGLAVLSFQFANNYSRAEADGNRTEVTDWYSVVVFGGRATQLSGKIRKGSFLKITGTQKIESYQDQQGRARHRCVINAGDIKFLRRRGAENPAASSTAASDAELCPAW